MMSMQQAKKINVIIDANQSAGANEDILNSPPPFSSPINDTSIGDDSMDSASVRKGFKSKCKYLLPQFLKEEQTCSGALDVCVRSQKFNITKKKWKSRFLVLRNDKVYILKGIQSTYAKAVIDMSKSTVEVSSDKTHPYVIKITSEHSDDCYMLAATFEGSRLEWFQALQKACKWREEMIERRKHLPKIDLYEPNSSIPLTVFPETDLDETELLYNMALAKVANSSKSASGPMDDAVEHKNTHSRSRSSSVSSMSGKKINSSSSHGSLVDLAGLVKEKTSSLRKSISDLWKKPDDDLLSHNRRVSVGNG